MVTITMRSYLSSQHLQAAAFFCRAADRLESMAPEDFYEHRGYVMGSIISSAAFLDAAVNELYLDAVDEHEAYVGGLNVEIRVRLAQGWKHGTDRMSVLAKFQMALTLAGQEPFDPGAEPYQGVNLLRRLRNKLVHFEPESAQAGLEEGEEEFERKFQGKFDASPRFAKSGNPFWPDKCLSHGCAKWCVQSALSFAGEFFARLNVEPNYMRLGSSLNLELDHDPDDGG